MPDVTLAVPCRRQFPLEIFVPALPLASSLVAECFVLCVVHSILESFDLKDTLKGDSVQLPYSE